MLSKEEESHGQAQEVRSLGGPLNNGVVTIPELHRPKESSSRHIRDLNRIWKVEMNRQRDGVGEF